MPLAVKEIFRNAAQKKSSFGFPFSSYNRKYNCTFIHVPKVAGTSIVEVLGQGKAKRHHLPWYVYYTANRSFFEQSFKFSFVRNPWDRTLSAYKYLASGGNQASDLEVAKRISKFDDFDDFVINGLGQGWYRNHLLFIPQSEFIVNGEQNIVVDFLGRYEDLDSDFEKISKRLNISKELANSNASKRSKDYKEYYKNERSIELISEIYSQDVRLFSYEY